ncbi:MAG: thiamine pyrophosphate-binding protein [Chloroflexi bacterium]|nr:thiamine pyrophosphate-binding protein [Chloroflexota bacterium]
MARIVGKHAFMEMLKVEGVRYIFGNPGTTELPFMDALQEHPQLQYILALQEATAVGMADGYARATGRPAFANLHVAGGLSNGISMLYDAYRGGTPLVLTAGQSDTRSLLGEPTLSGNLVEMCRQYSKWSAEILHTHDIPAAVRRAFKVAKTPPTGPVFLSLPWNVLDEEAAVEITPSSEGYFRVRPDEGALGRATRLLAAAENPVMLVGDRVAQSGGVAEAVRLAELLGARVYAAAFSEVNFPTGHPQYLGMLNLNSAAAIRPLLGKADVILAVGTNLFSQFLYTEPLLDSRAKVVHLDSAQWEIEKTFPVAVGMWADPKAGMGELAELLEEEMTGTTQEAAKTRARAIGGEKQAQRDAFRKQAQQVWEQRPTSVERLMLELKAALPPNAVIADESVSSRPQMMNALEFNEPGTFFSIRGGALGWVMPGALGIKLAKPDRPVVAVVGDGAAMYSIQALWTAARYNLPVTYVICNNGSYRVLKQNMLTYYGNIGATGRKSQFIGMDFRTPALDYAKLAEGYGVHGFRVQRPEEIRPTLERALGLGKPAVVDVQIDAGTF